MPFVISKAAAAVATAAVLNSPPLPEPATHETRCFFVPVRHVYLFDIYDTMQVECHLVPVSLR